MAETAKTVSWGLKKAYFGDVNPDGGMPTEMEQLARTYKNTASFTTEADTVNDFYCEEEPSAPVLSISSEAGRKQVQMNFLEWNNDVLKKVFGGTTKQETVTIEGTQYDVEKFMAPLEMVTIEKAVRIVTMNNVVLQVPRALVTARFNWNITRTEIAQIEITAKALAPNGKDDGIFEIFALGEPKTAGG